MKKDNELIINFIKDYQIQGNNAETIRKMLRIQGWSDEEIETGIKEAGVMPEPEVKKPQAHAIMTDLHVEGPKPSVIPGVLKKIAITIIVLMFLLAGAAYAFYKLNNPTVLIG